MNKESINITDFSKHLFWDINPGNLDFEKHDSYIINRVLQYGLYKDWRNILSYYGLERIKDISLKMRDLDNKSIEFISVLTNVPKEKFRCFILKQSLPKHWDF